MKKNSISVTGQHREMLDQVLEIAGLNLKFDIDGDIKLE